MLVAVEGRVSRVLKDSGYRVTATDPVEAFISAAEQAGSADDYKVAAVTNLPFARRYIRSCHRLQRADGH
jgi:Methyltransferase domain